MYGVQLVFFSTKTKQNMTISNTGRVHYNTRSNTRSPHCGDLIDFLPHTNPCVGSRCNYLWTMWPMNGWNYACYQSKDISNRTCYIFHGPENHLENVHFWCACHWCDNLQLWAIMCPPTLNYRWYKYNQNNRNWENDLVKRGRSNLYRWCSAADETMNFPANESI